MQEIEVNKTKVLTVPAGANAVKITHTWGDVVEEDTGLVPAASYSFTPDSIGEHKVEWMNGTTLVSKVFYESVLPLMTASEFFSENSNLESFEDSFGPTERKVRNRIQVVTGQKFGPYINKTIRIQGDEGHYLELPHRIISITSVDDQFEEDLTSYIEVASGEPFFLQYLDRFRRPFYQDYKRDLSVERMKQDFFTEKLDFTIVGSFGWEYVPNAVVEAAKLLIVDEFTGANDLRRQGMNEAQLGDFSYKLNADQWGTTGNTEADNLLADYTIMRLWSV